MSEAATIYNYERILQRELSKLQFDVNGEIIRKYYYSRVADGLSLARIIKCVSTLRLISRIFGKEFDNASKDQLVELVSKIERLPFGAWTKRDYKVILKKFYQWLRNCEPGEYPPEVKWIREGRKPQNNLTKGNLLSIDEVNRLVNAATTLRDKALILVLMESGRRIGEILTLKIGNIEFDEIGARLFGNGKTGADFSRIIASSPSLSLWLDNHPMRDNPKAPAWVAIEEKNRVRQLAYASARWILQDCVKRAGLKKRVYFHLFRHTRATQAATRLTRMQMCAVLGWKPGSKMPSVYVHLSDEDIDEAQSIMNGMSLEKENRIELQPRFCIRCKEKNSPVSKFCIKCGLVLDVNATRQLDETRTKLEILISKLTQEPEKLERLLDLIG